MLRFNILSIESVLIAKNLTGIGRGAGFTLSELAEVFKMHRTGIPPCRAVRDLLDQKLIRLSAQIEELSTFHSQLEKVRTQWNRKLRHAPPGKFVPLFDDLDHRPPLQIGQALKQPTKRRKPP